MTQGETWVHLRNCSRLTHRQALEFFVLGLEDVSSSAVDCEELLYNASVLAHYAQVSTQSCRDLPSPATLGAVFDQFVLDPTLFADGVMMETAGAQCLLLAGFFEDQMRGRHTSAGRRARRGLLRPRGRQASSAHRAHLLEGLARQFEPWRRRHARLGRELRDQAYRLS